MIRTARGQSERGGIARVRLDQSQKTPSNQLIQPGPIKTFVIKIHSRKCGNPQPRVCFRAQGYRKAP
jgi:hypothetical protein